MKHALLGTVTFALCLVTALPAQQGASPAVADFAKLVGVVDMVKVADAYPRREQIQASLAKKEQELTEKLKEARKRVETLLLELKALDKQSEEYAEKQHEVQVREFEYDALDKRYGRKMQELSQETLSQVYKEILVAVGEIAKQRGLALVFRARENELLAKMQRKLDPNENRDVLYFDKGLDISDDVIKLMKANPAPVAPDKDAPQKGGTSEAGSPRKTEK